MCHAFGVRQLRLPQLSHCRSAVKIGVTVGVTSNAGWFASIVADLVEIFSDIFEFVLDSLTRGNLDNDELG